jgi:hypothetical protein
VRGARSVLACLLLLSLAGCSSPAAQVCSVSLASCVPGHAPHASVKTLFRGTLSYGVPTATTIDHFQVDNGMKTLHADVYFNATAAGAWFLAPEPGATTPDVGIDDPKAGAHDVVYKGQPAGVAAGPLVLDHEAVDFAASPLPGPWSCDLDGNGPNVQVSIVITETPA